MKVIEKLKEEFEGRWLDVVAEDGEMLMGVNPQAFNVTADITEGADPETEVERIVRKLFEISHTAKVLEVSFTPTIEAFSKEGIGGKITISGTF